MKQIKFLVTLKEPILISLTSGDRNTIESQDYIPGSSILGLLANVYLKKNTETDEFYEVFFRNKLIFTNAYIVNNSKKSYPVPFSIQHEKDNKDDIYDLIYQSENFSKQTKPVGGFGVIKNGSIVISEINKSLNFHHQRDRKQGRPKKIIFNYRSIDTGQVFEGAIIGEETYLNKIKSLIEPEQTYYLGRSKTAQYGKVHIEIKEITEFTQEIENIDRDDKEGIVMTLISDAILYNDNGFSEVNIETMEKEIGVKIKKAFVKKDTSEIFISVWKAKKPMENVFKMGSCFLLEKLPENYKDMEIYGIGERTSEGFGRIVFGWQQEKQYTKEEQSQPGPENIQAPELAKNILTKIIENKLKDKIIINAFEDASKFTNNPITNSLIGRLSAFVSGDFKERLKELRKTAINKLESCNNKTQNLKEYLEGVNGKFQEKLNSAKNKIQKGLIEESGFNLSPIYEEKLKKIYLQSFFTQLRRQNKKR